MCFRKTIFFGVLAVFSAGASAMDATVKIELEATSYTSIEDESKFEDNVAVGIEPEIKGSFNDGDLIYNFTPFIRLDSRDEERQHADIRELHLLNALDDWELSIGISKVFWGVTESSHLVDIINQTDALEGIDGEDKLGQPMVRVSRSFEETVLTGFLLPGFREREFLGSDNPLALPFPINNDPVYQSDAEELNIDYALRFSGYKGIIDYGLSWFHGTSREPSFMPGFDGRLIPQYGLIDQWGVDIQATIDAWLWKLEVINRNYDDDAFGEDFTAAVGGFEYSFYGMADGLFDLGLLAEYHTDSRNDPSSVNFQNDLFLATRLAFNDAESSELLAGIFVDQDDDSTSLRIEGSRRVFGDAKLSLEAQAFSNIDENNVSYEFRNSDFVELSLELYF
ncbi:MAG: hypothetical protein KTR18_03940 [Acidiferrobacterales bacterium]|nr:hypothetical protein [Acidiferrobacterales bacterium]